MHAFFYNVVLPYPSEEISLPCDLYNLSQEHKDMAGHFPLRQFVLFQLPIELLLCKAEG
jgi:hypothetical protein